MFLERNYIAGNRITRHFFRLRQILAVRNTAWKRRDDNRKPSLDFRAENDTKLFDFRFHSLDDSTHSMLVTACIL